MFAGHAAHHWGSLGEDVGYAVLCADVAAFRGLGLGLRLGGGWWGRGVGDWAAGAGEEGPGFAVVVWEVAQVRREGGGWE